MFPSETYYWQSNADNFVYGPYQSMEEAIVAASITMSKLPDWEKNFRKKMNGMMQCGPLRHSIETYLGANLTFIIYDAVIQKCLKCPLVPEVIILSRHPLKIKFGVNAKRIGTTPKSGTPLVKIGDSFKSVNIA